MKPGQHRDASGRFVLQAPEDINPYYRTWRERNPDYWRDRRQIERLRRTRHLCSGNGRPCMVEIPGDRIFCTFCQRGAGTIYRSDPLATRMLDTWWPTE